MRARIEKEMSADDPRSLLIEAGLDLFGKYSFDGASTRMLTKRAEVNLAAIQYYFGGKKGLYLAVAGHIVEQIDGLLGPRLAKIQKTLKKQALSKEQSFRLLCELLDFFITGFLGQRQTDKWLTIIMREQLCPTEAFDVFFEGFMRPLDQALFGLVARIMDQKRDDREVKLRVFAIMGEVLMFHVSPGSVKRALNWENYGPENLEAIRRVILDNVKTIFSTSPTCSRPRSDTRNGAGEMRVGQQRSR